MTSKEGDFDKEVRTLIKQLEETVQAKKTTDLELGNMPIELTCLRRYLKIYNSTEPNEHYCYFETLYNSKRSAILKTLESDKWLTNGDIVIQYGSGIKMDPEMREKLRIVQIRLSQIYNMACDLRDAAEKSLVDIDPSLAPASKDLNRPNNLMLRLMRIFYYLNDSADKKDLEVIVSKLEDEMMVPADKRTTVQKDVVPVRANPIEAMMKAVNDGGLASMISSGLQMFAQANGGQLPEGSKMPSKDEIQGMIGGVMNSFTQGGGLQGVMEKFKDPNANPVEVMQGAMQGMMDPNTVNIVRNSLTDTAHLAVESAKQEQQLI